MTPIGSGPVLLCYDGSDGARRAIEWTGLLLPGAETIVLHLWDSPALGSAFAPSADSGPQSRERAAAVAEEGAALARIAGLRARPFPVGIGVEWESILAVAEMEAARLIVTGARGVSGVRSTLGSISNGVAHHARVPVLVVPPPSRGVPSSVFLHDAQSSTGASLS